MLLAISGFISLCAGGSINPSVQPGADASLPGMSGPAPVAAAPAASIGVAGAVNGTSPVPQSLSQSNSTLNLEGSSAWST